MDEEGDLSERFRRRCWLGEGAAGMEGARWYIQLLAARHHFELLSQRLARGRAPCVRFGPPPEPHLQPGACEQSLLQLVVRKSK
jgi:hypothetical protein